MLAEQEGDHTDEETKEQLEARIAKKCVGFGIGDADLEEANLTTSSNPVVNATAIDLGKPTPTTSFDPIVNNTPADVSLAPVLPRNITANETEDISMYPWRLVCNNRAGPNTHLWECGSATQHIWLTPFVCSQACCCNWDGFMRCPDYHNCEDYTLYFECAFTGTSFLHSHAMFPLKMPVVVLTSPQATVPASTYLLSEGLATAPLTKMELMKK